MNIPKYFLAFWVGILMYPMVIHAQVSNNMNLLYNYDDPNISDYNDVWGYEDNGTEVAIIGTNDSILFFDVTNTSSVVKLQGVAPGASSIWRDMKTYRHYCYGVSEGAEGLTIVNMNDLLSGTLTYQTISTDFLSAHNVWIDTAKAKLYLPGTNPSSSQNGLIIYDLQADPYNPTLVGEFNFSDFGVTCGMNGHTYVHDLFVRNDTAYCNMEADCGFHVFDVSNPDTPVYLGDLPSSAFQNGYNHSTWLSADGNTAVVAEETHGNPLHIVDVSNLSNMTVLGTYKDPLDPNNSDNIVHNPFIKGNYCYISYYHDGAVMIDISNPSNPTRVAYYDTDTNHSGYGGYEGAWGMYPYLPSGNLLVSDVNYGLFVLEVDQALLAIDWFAFDAHAAGEWKFQVSAHFQSSQKLEKAELYWSPDGIDFVKHGDLNYTSSHTNHYTIDERLERPSSSAFFVKVKTTEIDGYTSFSEVRRVEPQSSHGIEVFPNPASDFVNVHMLQKGSCVFYDLEGRQLFSRPLAKGFQKIEVPTGLPPGIYLLDLRNDQGLSIHHTRLQLVD